MKYLKIQNSGELDIRLVALMGGTTKANDKYKIGQFGTGLKYTLAYLYRNNIAFKIFSGPEQVNVSLQTESIKDTDFEIICINNQRTSITTQMGQQWSAWMIIRELWCNALDEGQELREIVYDDADVVSGEVDKTTFFLQLTPEIQLVLDDWKNYFIQDRKPIFEDNHYAIYKNEDHGKLRLYKHGVLIYQHTETESLFYYDIKAAEINELREFKGSVGYEVMNALASPGEDAVQYFLHNIKEDHYEGSELDYDWYQSFKSIWLNVIGEKRIARTGDSSYYSNNGIDVDFTNVIELPKKVYAALVKDFEGIGALAMADDKSEFYETQDFQLKERIIGCIGLLKEAGYNMNPEIVIRYGLFGRNQMNAASNRKRKTLMISEVCKKLTDEDLFNILVEHNEYLSIKDKKDSETFYRHFIKLFTEQLMSNAKTEINA